MPGTGSSAPIPFRLVPLLRSTLRACLLVVLTVLVLLFLVGIALYLPPVQSLAREKAVAFVEERTGADVHLGHIALRFPIGLTLRELSVADPAGDTLLNAGMIRARLSVSGLLGKEIVLKGVRLEHVQAHLVQRADSSFNFDFIVDGFAGGSTGAKPAVDTTGGWGFRVDDLALSDIRYDMALVPSGLELNARLGELTVDLEGMDLGGSRYHVGDLLLRDTHVRMQAPPGERSPDSYPDLENPLAGFDIRFEELDLASVSFVMMTSGTNDSLWLRTDRMIATAEEIDLAQQRVWLDDLEVHGLEFGMLSTDTMAAVDTIPMDPPWLDQHDGFRYFARDWDIRINELDVTGADLALHTDLVSVPNSFPDPRHLVLQDIRIDAEGFAFSNRMIALDLKNASLVTRPDSMPSSMAFALSASPGRLALFDVRIIAPGTDASMSLEIPHFDLSDTYRYPKRVQVQLEVEGRMDRSRILEFLAKDAPPGTEGALTFALQAEGSLDSLRSLQLEADDAGAARVALTTHGGQLMECPDCRVELALEELSITDAPGSLIRVLVGDAPLPTWLKGNLRARMDQGRGDLEIDLASDRGGLRGTLSGTGLTQAIPDSYTADLEFLEIDLAGITGDTLLSPISARVTGMGHALRSPERRAWLQVDPLEGTVAGTDVSSLCLQAEVVRDSVFADMDIQASPLVMSLHARGDLPDGAAVRCSFDLELHKADLGELQLMDREFVVRGRSFGVAELDSTGHGMLELTADGLQLTDARHEFEFKRFRLQGTYGTDSLAVNLDSDALTLNFSTNTSPDELGQRIADKLLSYLRPDLEFEPDPDAVLRLDASLPRPELFAGLLVPSLHKLEVEQFHVAYSGASDALEARISVPTLAMESLEVTGFDLVASGTDGDLRTTLHTERVESGSWYVPRLALNVGPRNDWLQAELSIGAVDSITHRLALFIQDRSDTLLLRLAEEQLLAGTSWAAHADNLLRLAPDHFMARDLVIRNGERKVGLVMDEDDVLLEFTDLPLEGLTSMVRSTDSIELASGLLQGEVRFSPDPSKADLRIMDLHVLDADIGDLHALMERTGDDEWHIECRLARDVNRLDVISDLDLSEGPSFTAQADIGLADLSFLGPFLEDLLFDVEGGLHGKVDVEQRNGELHSTGDLTFDHARFGMVQTGALYRVPNGQLHLDGRNVHLNAFHILDSLDQDLVLDGALSFSDLSAPVLDMRIRTDRFRAIHSTAKQNDVFYGDLFGRLDLTAKGPVAHPLLKGSVAVLPGTRFSVVLPGSEVELVESEGVVVFTDDLFGTDTLIAGGHAAMVRDSILANLPGVDLDVQLHVDSEAEFFIVLDPASGDEASVRGQGDLSIRYDAAGNMDLRGTFEVLEGGYTLEFYGLVHKRFDMVKGSTITWSGDPVKAVMDLTAQYRSVTPPYALVIGGESLPEDEQNRLKKPLPFDVLIHFTGNLDDPELAFELRLDEQLRRKFPMVDTRLDALDQPGNKEELDRQVFGLLVLNSFIQDTGTESIAAADLATSAARNSMNGLLTDQLNELTGRFLKGVDISVGMYTYDQSSGGRSFQRTSLDYKVSKRLINDRLTFEVGGALDMDDQSEQVNNVSNTRAAEYAILYDLTPDGRFQLRGFHENSYDLYDGEITRSGAAFLFTRDYLVPARQAAHDVERSREEDQENEDQRPDAGIREDE